MNSPYRVALATSRMAPVYDRTLQTDGRSYGVMPLTRKYEIAHLSAMAQPVYDSVIAPATPAFEDAFAALGRGSLIATQRGLVAVEDLVPGQRIETAHAGLQTLLWIGSMTLRPSLDDRSPGMQLVRVAADSFGVGRPMSDLMLGPRARLLFQNPACVPITGQARAFAPATGFTDGMNVVQITPVAGVEVYHLGFLGQQAIFANGLEVESFHPGPDLAASMAPDMIQQFMALFPHINSLRDFGALQTGRLTGFELEQLRYGG